MKFATCAFYVLFLQLLFGSISSIEDHGYRVDLGIKGIQAFLAAKDAEKLISKQGKR